jgi:prepilin-type N-terminal cleavage/methylation domain-containing protein
VRRRGFTLAELLIAMTISAIVLAMAIGIYQRQERSYSLQNEVSERQQNVRVAMDMIVRDLRMAGHATHFQVGANLDLDGDAAPDSLILNARDNVAPANDDIANGTDVVTIVYGRLPHQFLPGPPSEFAQGNNIVLGDTDFDNDGFGDIGITGVFYQMPFGVVYDLTRGDAFKITGQAGFTLTTSPAVGNYPPGSYISPLNVVRYWVDNEPLHGASDALDLAMPRLMRRNFGRDMGAETVAENITGLQLQYGLDRDGDGTIDIDGWVNDFSAATDRPEDALAVRVWVLGQNPTPRPGHVDQLNATMGNVVVGPAPLYVRQMLTSEVQLRNKR